ncbi:ribonuclease T2 isoform X1 [Halyomorpha halys]|uniref:ribonuclease T2 isoform X1 n=2 Tax=Halyomorpha halys TaxID=286706 RepID=UPI0006D4F799|nr:ribonuclease T2 isoform X1 [Halyomorpha halys]
MVHLIRIDMEKRTPYYSTMIISKYRHISPTTLLIVATLFIFCSFSLIPRVVSFNDEPWDLIIFTQNWPRSVCNQWVQKGHECRLVPNDTWTIHGIWPTKYGTIGPGFCNKSRPFSPEALYGIENQLEQLWTPIEKHKKITALWSHEWLKHGTCAAIVPKLSTEFQYFNQGLEWMKDYNMHSVLEKAGITPGNEYNITKIWDGVQNVLGKNPQVACYNDKKNSSILLEIRICFNRTLELVDCDGTVVGGHKPSYHNLTNCDMNKLVQYPVYSVENIFRPGTNVNKLVETYKILKLVQWFTGSY